MSVSFDGLRTLLGEVPPTATIRVACAGSSSYLGRGGLELTTTADGAYLKLQGRTGTSPDAMSVGAVVVNPERVDFIQVIVP